MWKRADNSTERALVVFTTTTRHDDESEWSLHQLAVFLHKRMDREELSERLFDDIKALKSAKNMLYRYNLPRSKSYLHVQY